MKLVSTKPPGTMEVTMDIGPMQYHALVKRLDAARDLLSDICCRKGIGVEFADAHDAVADAHTHLHNARKEWE